MNCKHIHVNSIMTLAVRSEDRTILGYNKMVHCKFCGKVVCKVYENPHGPVVSFVSLDEFGGDGRRNEKAAQEALVAG